jgi:GAF domain-containing protein
MTDTRLLDTARRLAESLKPGDLDATLAQITRAAVEVLPDVDYASITVKHEDGTLGTAAWTDEILLEVDRAQYEMQEGPCYYAAVETAHVTSSDLAADERFPNYAAVALGKGIRAQAGIRLFDAPRSQGALDLYSTKVGSFEDFESLAALFAHQAAIAIGYASEVQNLNEAIRTRQTIGQAVGIVMERYGLTDERAFAFLTRLSQHRNVKLRLVAQEVIAASDHRGDGT